jgi:hypothetical protein
MGLVVVFSVLAALVLLDWGPSIVRWQLAARRARRSRERQAAVQQPGAQPLDMQQPVVQQAPASRSWSAAGSDSEREEAALVADLLAGDLPAARYHRLMADLAARDASRNPLVVPPHLGER